MLTPQSNVVLQFFFFLRRLVAKKIYENNVSFSFVMHGLSGTS